MNDQQDMYTVEETLPVIYETLDGSHWKLEEDGDIEIIVPLGNGGNEYVTLTHKMVEKMLEVMVDFEKTKG